MITRYIFLINQIKKSYLTDYLATRPNFATYSIYEEVNAIAQQKYNLYSKLEPPDAHAFRNLLIAEELTIKKRFGNEVFIRHIADKIAHNDYISKLKSEPLKHIIITNFKFQYEYEFLNKKFTKSNGNPQNQPTIVTIATKNIY